MVMSEQFEKGPRPLAKKYYDSLVGSLREHKVTRGGAFNEFGVFSIAHTKILEEQEPHDLPPLEDSPFLLWQRELLEEDPQSCSVAIAAGNKGVSLWLRKPGRKEKLSLAKLREVQRFGAGVVGESGYLIDTADKVHAEVHEKALRQAARGEKPFHLENTLFAKIEPVYPPGQELVFLELGLPLNVLQKKEDNYEDLLVINPKSRGLVGRILERPLAFDRFR